MSLTTLMILWGFVHGTYLEKERDEPFYCLPIGLIFRKPFFEKVLFE
jgi:hypothetical protein